MPTLTIPDIPEEVLARLSSSASHNGRSIEEEVRELISRRFATREEALRRVRSRWDTIPPTPPEMVQDWRQTGRN